jgi:lysophospholipase L1-like esterase
VWTSIPEIDRAGSERHGPPLWVRIAVPLAAAAILWALGQKTMALVVLAIAGSLVVAGLVSRAAERAILRAGAWLARVVGTVLSYVLLGAVYLLVFMPVSLILRLTRHDPLHARPDPSRASYWLPLRDERHRPLPRWQFAVEPAQPGESSRGGPIRSMVTALAVLFLLNLVAGVLLQAAGLGEPRGTDPRVSTAAHRGEAWVPEFYREFEESNGRRYAGFVIWRRLDYAGKHINIESGIRQSYQSTALSGRRPLEVFFFGGSTMWGTGNRDLHTIPSAFARLAEADGIPVRVTNYGESGYVSWQEVVLLSQLCASGQVPDLAVFYDGVNDMFVQVQQPTDQFVPQNFERLRNRFEKADDLRSTLARFSAAHIAFRHFMSLLRSEDTRLMEVEDLSSSVDELAANTARLHDRAMEHARRMGEAYGFQVASFWQPCVYTKNRVHDGEEPMLEEFGPGIGTLYKAVSARVNRKTLAITDALDRVDGPVMVDWCHTNESGAGAVAATIYERVKPLLEPGAGGDGGR